MTMTINEYIQMGRAFTATGEYNGRSVLPSVNPVQRKARYYGPNAHNPMVCCITGYSRPDDPKGAGYMFTHLENYWKPLDWYAVSKRTHAILHARFHNPRRFFDMVADHYVHGAWFTMLLMSPKQVALPFARCYPNGLPLDGEVWPEFATAWGLSADLFRSADMREPLRALWKWPDIACPESTVRPVSPPARRRPIGVPITEQIVAPVPAQLQLFG